MDTAFQDAIKAAGLLAKLQAAHYPFSRGDDLHNAFVDCLTHYVAGRCSMQRFEARGLMVTGQSRMGKTRELNRLITKFNESGTLMPDGRPVKILQIQIKARSSWKSLAFDVIDELGYPMKGSRTQHDVWARVLQQAERQGYIGIHVDEAQHIFTETGQTANMTLLDSFKGLLKDRNWPMMVILSGVPALAQHIEKENIGEERRQLRFLLQALHFSGITSETDIAELADLTHSYAALVNISANGLDTDDFYRRLAHAACYRWGYAIELVIAALHLCATSGQNEVTAEHFNEAFARQFGLHANYTPFTQQDYEAAFDPDNLHDLINREH